MKRTFMASNFIASNTKIEKINLLSLHFLYPYYFLIHFVPKRSTNFNVFAVSHINPIPQINIMGVIFFIIIINASILVSL